MSEHFIKNIEIKNFKCFEDFKTEGFGRVNLIGGKNNVGKTAFMEACWINSGSISLKKFIAYMRNIKFMREELNIIGATVSDTKNFIELSNHLDLKSNINHIVFNINEKSGIKKYEFIFNKETVNVNVNDFSYSFEFKENNQFIHNYGLTNTTLISTYSYLQKKDKEDYLNKILNKFDNSIEAFKIIDETPQCKKEGIFLELTELGDGVKHIVSIITKLYQSQSGHLYIDEIDNGIHYSMLDELWKVILVVSEDLDVQVFATTHSKECIESYARVAKKLEETDIKFLSLYRNKDNELKSITFDYQKIQDRIELGLDNR